MNTGNRPQARENAFASDWLRGWGEFSRPITARSKAKPMQSRVTFDTQLKIALNIIKIRKSLLLLRHIKSHDRTVSLLSYTYTSLKKNK